MRSQHPNRTDEQGYMLAVLMFAVAMVMITLAIAAPRLARSIQRDRELEAVQRAHQYVRAIQLYYRKFGTYPTSIDQLVNTNNIRFLRQKYADPMTGKDNWRLIHLGQNKTQSTGFFGKPLSGVGSAGGGLGGNIGSNTASNFSTSDTGSNSPFGSSSLNGNSANSTSPTGSSTLGGTSSGTTSMGGGMTSTSATSFTGGGGGPIIGVSSVAPGKSMIVVHEKDHYVDWEFFYDPLVDQMKAAAMAAGGTGGVGSNTVSNFGNSPTGTGTGTGANGSSSIFGNSFGSSNGSNSTGSNGSTTSSPTSPTTSQQ